jgi:hypothetical protein
MRITVSEYRDAENDMAGYCPACDKIHDDNRIEPDAYGRRCPECGKATLMGVEEALLRGFFDIDPDQEEPS